MTTEQLSRLEKLHAETQPSAPAEIYQWFPEMAKALRDARADEKKTRDFYLDRVDELRSEIKRLNSALRMLWDEARDYSRCQVEAGYGHHLSQPCQNAVVAALSRVTL